MSHASTLNPTESRCIEKYEIVLRTLGKEVLTKSHGAFKDATSLIDFRNELMHFKPLWPVSAATPPSADAGAPKPVACETSRAGRKPAPDFARRRRALEAHLHGKFELSQFVDPAAPFLSMRCMCSGCADWAVGAAEQFVSAFQERSGLLDDHGQFRSYFTTSRI